MSLALSRPMSPAEFLFWEERQEGRHEFDGEHVHAMTGGTAAHAAIQGNLLYTLIGALRGKPCRAFGPDLKVATARGFRYPDALVVCSPVPPRATVVPDPVILFEIVSPASVLTDFQIKNAEYRAIPSVRRYIVLQQRAAAAAVFFRQSESWLSELVSGPDAALLLPEIDLAIPLSELYRDVELDPEPDPDRDRP
ncbi:MAG: Uma2 family endonuclease [Gluconacetobacter diazotrophicus]|nr:Uma2 family endonuclease [Gluconacetobacter diazotrophicus]